VAVDTQKLFYLLDPVFQIENLAGKPVVGGHIEVFIAGTDTKYITWQDWDGARNPFKIPLKSDGRAVILVEPQYTYDVYVYDSFNNMVCSRLNVSPAIGGDVSVSGLTQVFHDETISGNGTPQEPIGVVSAGKVYQGIEPIVVNNDLDKISANHVPLGVQDPLYFVQDDEEGCIIGFSGQTIPEGVMTESGLGFENDKITGYNGSAFSAGNEYEAGSYISITDNTISVTGLQPEGDYAYNSALSSKLDVTASSQFLTGLPEDLMYSGDMTAYQPVGDYQTAGDYLSASDSANFLLTGDSANFLLTSDSGNFYPMEGNPSGFLTAHQSLDDYATKQWVEDKGYITGIDIAESANWNEATTVVNNNSAIWNSTTETVSSNSAAWGSATPQIPVTGINGIKISESGDQVVFEVSGDYYTNDNPSGFITGVDLSDYATTAQLAEKQDSLSYGYHDTAISSIDESAIYDTSAHARINTLAGRISDLSSNKLDTSAFSDVSGTFLTAHQDLSDYQTTAGMTAYQEAGDYYSASNPSGFITGVDLTPYQTIEGMTAYQPVGDYLTTADSANFYTTANESGFITGVDLTPYQLTADMTGYLTTADSANFLTAVPDTYLQNTDLTISDGKITEISGVPLSAGDEFPQSATEAIETVTANSADWNGTTETVSSNSGAWGGSALPISAGNGVKISLQNDTLVFESDETVLVDNGNTAYNASFTLNEPLSSFERFRIYGCALSDGKTFISCMEQEPVTGSYISYNGTYMIQNGYPVKYMLGYSSDNDLTYTILQSRREWTTPDGTAWACNYNPTTDAEKPKNGFIYKVVGINRIAGE